MLPRPYVDALQIPPNCVICVDDLTDNLPLSDGIYFVIAKWSGASQLVWRELNKLLAGQPLPVGFALHVVDTDKEIADRLFDFPEARRAGKGEILIVRNGKPTEQVEVEKVLDRVGSLYAE